MCLHTLVLTFALDCRLVLYSTVSTFARSTSQQTVSLGVVYVAGIGQPGIPMSIASLVLWGADVWECATSLAALRLGQIRVFGNVWHRDARYKICTT